ncbi:MAG: ABC transporter permease [Deltaproteobacteria bacterium]|nr:ABC transporter permease [Deltaproteobacteria bacterium]
MGNFLQETRAQLVRWLIHTRREPFSMAFNLLNPIILLIFMGGAFQSLAKDFTGGDYRAYLLPGILALTAFGNSLAGGISLLFDKENGFLLRLMSAPVSRGSILVSRFLAVNINTILQCAIVLILGLLFGVHIATGLTGAVTLLLISLLLGFGVTVISLILAFVLENHGDFFAILGITALPLTFLSSAFVPVESLPAWMRFLAQVNPMTYAVDGMRTLALSGWNGSVLARMAVVLVIFDVAMFWIGSRVLRRHLA